MTLIKKMNVEVKSHVCYDLSTFPRKLTFFYINIVCGVYCHSCVIPFPVIRLNFVEHITVLNELWVDHILVTVFMYSRNSIAYD